MTKGDDSLRDYLDDFHIRGILPLLCSTLNIIKNITKLEKNVTQNKKLIVRDGTDLSKIDQYGKIMENVFVS